MKERPSLWRSAKGLLGAFLICGLAVELCVQLWVLRVFSAGSFTQIAVDGHWREATMADHLQFAIQTWFHDVDITLLMTAITFLVIAAAYQFVARLKTLRRSVLICAGAIIGALVAFGLLAIPFPVGTAANYAVGAASAGAFLAVYLRDGHMMPNKTMEPTR